MDTWDELKLAKLGEPFSDRQIAACCRAVYGGAAWPGKNPGFGVVVAMSQGNEDDASSYEICLLDQCESFDMPSLIRACMELDKRWQPQVWFAPENGAAAEFQDELNENAERPLDLAPTDLVDVDPLYPYILGTLKGLLAERDRKLFLKDSRIVGYLSQIEAGEIAELELGAFPAIEALAFAVIELLRDAKVPALSQTHTSDGPALRNEREFDHLLKPGATDPGPDYDTDFADEDI